MCLLLRPINISYRLHRYLWPYTATTGGSIYDWSERVPAPNPTQAAIVIKGVLDVNSYSGLWPKFA
jgi:hypothetical protein